MAGSCSLQSQFLNGPTVHELSVAELEALVDRACHAQQPRSVLLKRNDVLGLENAWLRLKLRQARKRNKKQP